MSKYISYFFFRLFVAVFWIIPFPIMYFLSNGLAWLLRVVIKYRGEVIHSNLNRVFGIQSKKERKELVKKIYLNLSDITLEGIKGISMSLATMTSRHHIQDSSIIKQQLQKHDEVILVAAHYCNWEWGTGSLANLELGKIIAVYKKLSNQLIDQYLVKKRSKWGVLMIPTKDTKSTLLKKKEYKSVITLAADQSPSNIERAIWVDFLDQKTACIHGPEMFSKKLNVSVVYGHCNRIGRGRYVIDFELIANAGEDLQKGEITTRYMKCLEQDIKKKPENWLWSHKRWKHSYIQE